MGKTHGPGETKLRLQASSPRRVTTVCDHTCEVLPTKEAHPGLGILGFY